MGKGSSGKVSRAASIETYGDPEYGKPSKNGEMKKAIAYHGTSAHFTQFDADKRNVGHNVYGAGVYLTRDRNQALLYGDHVYEVEITYSTDRRMAKRTGRERDFQYSDDTGYWVIPPSAVKNLRITGVSDSGLSVNDIKPGEKVKIHKL